MFKTIQASQGYRIKTVSDLTGLSTHVIRKWEERYLLLTPIREHNGYRQYSEDDIQLLMYLQWQISNGETIGQLANIGVTQLQQAMNDGPIDMPSLPPEFQPSALTTITAARRLDRKATESSVHTLVNQLGIEDSLYRVLFPVLKTIGDLWHQGRFSMTGEHLVTQAIRHQLASSLRRSHHIKNPTAILACAPDNFHEIGAMTAAMHLQNNGWNPVYLGVNSDIDLIRLACERRQGRLIVLSTVLEQPEKEFMSMIHKIKKKLLCLCPVLIGGQGALKFLSFLEEQGIMYVEHVHQLQTLRPSSLHSNLDIHNNTTTS
ncbi:MerR family transcriptional regulator [Candidatus Nitrospira salsa]